MALDPFVEPKTFRTSGGDIDVVADGGEHRIESGGTQTIESGGKIAIPSGGEIEVASGGIWDFQSGGTGFFGDRAITANELKFDLLSRITVTQHGSASIVNAGSVLAPAYGIHTFSAATGMSKASMTWPTTGNSGVTIELNFSNFLTDANISIVVSTSGVVYPLGSGPAISNIQVSAGGHFKAVVIAQDTWAIVDQNDSVGTQALA